MAAVNTMDGKALHRRALRLEWLTVAWNVVGFEPGRMSRLPASIACRAACGLAVPERSASPSKRSRPFAVIGARVSV